MFRTAIACIAALLIAGEAAAQTPPPLAGPPNPAQQPVNPAAKAMVGTWEFSNADRDLICNVTFVTNPGKFGFALAFDELCAGKIPIVADIVGWSFPENDLLRLYDARGKALIEFSEVESGIYEAPTPGVGVLFLQDPAIAAASAPAHTPDQFAGEWTLMRGADKPLCVMTLSTANATGGFALSLAPDCEPSIVKLNFSSWRLDRGELVLMPAAGNVWRFEEEDGKWLRLPADVNPITLVRKK